VEKANLRVNPSEFMQQLLEDKRLVMGRFDARITAFNSRGISDSAEFDPSLSGYLSVYSGTFNDYVRRSLRYENDLQYEVLSSRLPGWNYGTAGNGYTRVADELRRTMIKQPTMRVLIAAGYYDLATPYFAADYTVNQMDLPKEIRSNFIQRYYEGGHMMYHNVKALEQLKGDMRELIEGRGR
jgi:carboxypeptidase C (cathepsin A)